MVSKKNVRELYTDEYDFINHKINELQHNADARMDFLDELRAINNPDLIQTHKAKEYRKLYYSGGLNCARNYLKDSRINLWNIFDLYAEASLVGKTETFQDYLNFYLEVTPIETIVRNLYLHAFSLISYADLKRIISIAQLWDEYWLDIKTFFINSHLLTVFLGKKREEWVAPHIKTELERFNNLNKFEPVMLAKTSPENDMKFRGDYVVLTKETRKPVLLISVKSKQYEYTSAYKDAGERGEDAGHDLFREQFNSEVIIIISQPELPNNSGVLEIVGKLRPALYKLGEKDETNY